VHREKAFRAKVSTETVLLPVTYSVCYFFFSWSQKFSCDLTSRILYNSGDES